MTLLGLLAGYFTIFAAGFGVALLISRATRINLVEHICLAWLFGAGIVSLLLWLCGMFVPGLALQLAITILCVALGVAGWRIKQHRQIQFSLPRPQSRFEWILAGVLAIELAIIFFVSLKHTLGWDGLFNWEIKARYAFLNSGVLPGSYYSSSGRAFSHPEYPLAIPFTELWLYLWMGAPHQFWIKTIFPIFYIAGALLLAMFVARISGKRWLGLLVALLVPFVPFVTASPGGVIVGYADIPLAVFYLTALGYLLCGREGDFFFYGAALTFVPWIKSEGIILWAVLVVIGLVVAVRQHRVRLFLLSILPGVLLIVSWRIYLKAMHAVIPSDFARPTFEVLRGNLNRIGGICATAFAEMSEPSHWSIFWLLALVAVIYLLVARNFPRLLLAIAVIAPIFLYLSTYIFSAWPSYTAHITSSLPRLLLQVMPAAWLAIGLALAPRKIETQSAAPD